MNTPARFACRLRMASTRWPRRTALIDSDNCFSFAALNDQVSQRAADLQRQGLGAETWAALRIRNTASGIIDWLAVLRAGARVIPLSERLPQRALQDLLLEHSIPTMIPAPGAYLQHTGLASSGTPASALCWHYERSQPCAGVASSGSTGAPRIVAHSYVNYVRNAQGALEYLPLCRQDRYLLSLPLFHVGGLGILFRCMEAGVPMVLGGRAEDASFLSARQITHVSMVETQLRRLLSNSTKPLPTLRCVLLGGGPVSTDLLRQARDRGLPCYMSYGLTEMTAQVATGPALTSAGRVLRYRELQIDSGEICVRGETLCLGYLVGGRVVKLETADGWFRTSDLGHWENGQLRIIGRRDNQFISGGENIQPEAIETVLRAHPQVHEAAVIPRSDREFGQRPVAFIRTEGDLDPSELQHWLRARLSPHQVPIAWHPMPDTQGLKIRRPELIALAERLRDGVNQ